MGGQVRAIVWAQWRSLLNHRSRKRGGGFSAGILLGTLWYAAWSFAAATAAIITANPENLPILQRSLPGALFGVFLYWQIVPVMMVSSGLSLDLNRLLAYPIPHRQLFAIEVALRVTTALEMMLVSAGLFVGLLLNPALPKWAALSLIPFVSMNLLLSAGLRDMLGRAMKRKGARELLVFLIILLSALPQWLLSTDIPEQYSTRLGAGFGRFWPWSAAAHIALGSDLLMSIALSIAWGGAAYIFGRWQFERTLQTDIADTGTAERTGKWTGPLDALTRRAGSLLGDPFGALLEKEFRVLSRSPRFRLLFLMGFSFGLLIWLPMAMRAEESSALRTNYLTVVTSYSLMLMGEILFWNHFGMDRSAAQFYFAAPLRISTVIASKNLVAAIFVFLEVGIVAVLCALLRLPVSGGKVAEAFAVTAVLTLFLLSAGNLMSTRTPRPVNPAKSWRTNTAGGTQMFLLVLYPVISIPVLLAYGARYAFESDLAFYAVLAIDTLIGAVVYSIALESAAHTAAQRKERILFALSQTEGPVAG